MQVKENCIQIYTYNGDGYNYKLCNYMHGIDNLTIEVDNIIEDIMQFIKQKSKSTKNLVLGINYFRNEAQHKVLKNIMSQVKDSQQFHLNSFSIQAKFMNLRPHNWMVLTDFLKIVHPSLSTLNIDLKGNYLQAEGISHIFEQIKVIFPNIIKLEMNLIVNSSGEAQEKSLEGFNTLLSLEKLEIMNLELDHNSNLNNLFRGIENNKHINNSLKVVHLSLKDNKLNMSTLSNIFRICQNLETLHLEMEGSEIVDMSHFAAALSASHLKNLKIGMYRANSNSPINEIIGYLLSSQELVSLDINFRYIYNKLSQFSNIFDNLSKAKKLESLSINMQNNMIGNSEVIEYANQIGNSQTTNLRHLHINIINDKQELKLKAEQFLPLESAILSIPNLRYAYVGFTSQKDSMDQSTYLKQFSTDVTRVIHSQISYTKNVKQFMMFNPTFIFDDLYF